MTKSYLRQGQNLWAGIENENHNPGIQNHKRKKDQQPHSWHGYSDEAAAPQDCMDNGTMGDNATTLPVRQTMAAQVMMQQHHRTDCLNNDLMGDGMATL